MKKALFTVVIILNSYTFALAKDTVHFGYGMYVGGANVADTRAELSIDSNNNYTFKALIFTQGFTSFITDYNFVTTAKGKILNNTVKFKSQVSASTSNFGDTYTILKRQNKQTTITRYPDTEEVDIENLPDNPLAKANDSISSILTLMRQIKLQKKCNVNMITVTNNFIYQVKSQPTKNKVFEANDYNLAQGKAISCLVEFQRLNDKDKVSKYQKMFGGDKQQKHESKPPVFHFMKLKGIPYYIPVSIEASERSFGAFRLNLQYVRYGNTEYKTSEWDDSDSFPQEDIDELKQVPQRLLDEAKDD